MSLDREYKDVIHLLSKFGYKEKEIRAMSPETEIVRDLSLEGDSFEDFFEVMQEVFGMDLSELDTRRYTYGESELIFPKDLVRRWKEFRGHGRKFDPINLRMIKASIEKGKWQH